VSASATFMCLSGNLLWADEMDSDNIDESLSYFGSPVTSIVKHGNTRNHFTY
jgi:hypothetical protein